MTETTTIEYDVNTGLPVLPEGYFWRVGDRDFRTYWYGEDKTNREPIMKAAVMIMKRVGVVTKERKVPVYGKHWWNKNQIVDEEVEYYTELGGPVEVMYAAFEDLKTQDKSFIPDFAEVWTTLSRGGVDYEWYYNIPMNSEGIAFVAGRLYKDYLNSEKEIAARQEVERARLEAKDKFYGDYPPKSLVTP